MQFLLLLLYLAASVLLALTLTVFPGGVNGVVTVDPLVLLEEVSTRWTFDDQLRTAVVAVIFAMPIGGWLAVRKASRSMAKERRAALGAINALDRLITDNAMTQPEARRPEGLVDMIVANGTLDRSAKLTLRLLGDVASKAMLLRQEPMNSILQGYREHFAALIAAVTPFQRLSLQIGILFTFVGLTLAFAQTDMTGVIAARSQQPIEALFGALNVAFGTSIAGLVSSLFIILFGNSLRSEYGETMLVFEKCVDQVYRFGRMLPVTPDYIDHIEQVRDALHGHARSADGLLKQNAELTGVIQKGIGAFGETRERYEGALKAMAEEQTRLLQSFNAYVEALKPENLERPAASLAGAALKPMRQHLEESTAMLRQSVETTQHLAQITEELTKLQTATAADVAAINARLTAMQKAMRRPRQDAGPFSWWPFKR